MTAMPAAVMAISSRALSKSTTTTAAAVISNKHRHIHVSQPPAASATNSSGYHSAHSSFRKVLASIPIPVHASRFASTSAALAAAVMASSPLPALAAEIEKAALFDFNLTLPAIAAEFLLLMFALDKIYFTPLGKFMDERDATIRGKLGDVKDTSSDVKQLEEQAAAIMKAARAEISAALNQMKKETTTELEAKLAEGRKKVEAELAEALQNMEKEKEETIKALDSQIAALSDEIVNKVLPAQ